jgi:hypothetical protein
MNVERFRATIDLMTGLDGSLRIQTLLEQIRDSLINLSNAPTQPQHQTSLANALTALLQASERLAEQITPEQFRLIDELGGLRYFDPRLGQSLKTEIAENAMTPSIPRDFVQKLSSDRADYLRTLNTTLQGLEALGIEGEELKAAAADVSFAIPSDIFENHLGDFAKELIFIDRLMKDLGEALTGDSDGILLESLSSSTPTVAITAGVKVISALAEMVGKFLDAWEKVEKFREARQTLVELGLSGKAIEEVTDQIATTVEEVVEESVEVTLSGFNKDSGRKNELRNALTQDTRRLFGQIERGLTIQFRAMPEEAVHDDDTASLATIREAAQNLHFPERQSEPMLLASGSVVEGDVPVFKYVKKTTSRKTTTSKTVTH